jgi:hypothetical protein
MFKDNCFTQKIALLNTELEEETTPQDSSDPVSALAVNWAKKYYKNVITKTHHEKAKCELLSDSITLNVLENSASTVDKLLDILKVASEMAWEKVESLFGLEILHHDISDSLIQPLQIINDSRHLYHEVIITYADLETPSRLSVLLGKEIMEIRIKYTKAHPLVLGLMNLQCHYVGQMLWRCLSPQEKVQFVPFLKILEDYLYIPFPEIHEITAENRPNSPTFNAVQHLLPFTSKIGRAVYKRVSKKYQGYPSNSGSFNKLMVKFSSIRYVEIFQCYLCWCVLEGSISPIKQDLLPLCVMLYPCLNVSWKLVQDMLLFMFWELNDRLSQEDMMIFLPYMGRLMEILSDEVFSS